MSPSWGTLSSLSASSMSDLLKGAKVWCCDDSRWRSRAGWKQQIPFVSGKEESDNICCRVMCSPLVLAMPRGPLSVNNKSGHLTAGHFTAATLTHTSSPGSSLPNLPCLDTKKMWHATVKLLFSFWRNTKSTGLGGETPYNRAEQNWL